VLALVGGFIKKQKFIMKDLSKIGGEIGREDTQWYAQHLAATLLAAMASPENRLWLDIGAGLGKSKERITPHGFVCITQDPAPGLPVEISKPLHEVLGEFGVVSAFDVIEHIFPKDIPDFLKELVRLSSEFIVISAPYDQPSEYHAAAYSPEELLRICSSLGSLVCAYDLFDGRILRNDFRIGLPGAFGGLLIFRKKKISF
jgi:hypothetical protein